MKVDELIEGLKDMKGKYKDADLYKITFVQFIGRNTPEYDIKEFEDAVHEWNCTIAWVSDDKTTYTILGTEYDLLNVLEYTVFDEERGKAEKFFNQHAKPATIREGLRDMQKSLKSKGDLFKIDINMKGVHESNVQSFKEQYEDMGVICTIKDHMLQIVGTKGELWDVLHQVYAGHKNAWIEQQIEMYAEPA